MARNGYIAQGLSPKGAAQKMSNGLQKTKLLIPTSVWTKKGESLANTLDDELFGAVGLVSVTASDDREEIGYWTGKPFNRQQAHHVQ